MGLRKLIRKIAVIGALAAAVGGQPVVAAEQLVWWHWNSAEQMGYLQPLLREFEDRFDCQVVPVEVPWTEIKSRLELAAVSQGTAALPDVVSVSSLWFPQVANLGLLADLTQYWDGEQEPYRDVFPGAVELWQNPDGRLLAYPFDLDIQALLYNSDMFAQAGLTVPDNNWHWDDLYDAAVKLSTAGKTDSLGQRFGFSSWYFSWAVLVWANGGTLINSDGSPGIATPEAAEALTFYRKFFASEVQLNADENAAAAAGLRYPPELWRAGRVGMMPAGSWAPHLWTWDTKQGRYLFPFGVAHLPLSPRGRRAVMANGQGTAIVKGSSNQELAVHFLKFLLEDAQVVVAQHLNQFPVRRTLAASLAFAPQQDEQANRRVFVEAAQYARPLPKSTRFQQIWPAMQRHVSRYLTGRVEWGEMLQDLDAALTGK